METEEKGHWRVGILLAFLGTAFCLCSCTHMQLPHGPLGLRENARVCERPTVRALAHDLDNLEAQIERFGSITVQHPSVWGQSRMQKHREDVEKQLAPDLSTFQPTLQGYIWRSDQAYFVNAMALNAAISSRPASLLPPLRAAGASTSSSSSSSGPAPATIPIPTSAVIPSDVTAVFGSNGITRTAVAGPVIPAIAIAKNGLNLEPTIQEDQKKRFLDHLNELRRINEGDDTADSPGYSLNLVRVPVSVLPGKKTEQGFAAEVTMTIKPYLSPELLPPTFRNLVTNDLLDQIAIPLTQHLNDADLRLFMETMQLYWEWQDADAIKDRKVGQQKQKRSLVQFLKPANESDRTDLRKLVTHWEKVKDLPRYMNLRKMPEYVSFFNAMCKAYPNYTEVNIFNLFLQHQELFPDQFKKKRAGVIAATRLRNAQRPFPPSQLLDIMGVEEAFNLALLTYETINREPTNLDWVHYSDVQGFLQQEIAAAHKFLADSAHFDLWENCNPELANFIHMRKFTELANARHRFMDQARELTQRKKEEGPIEDDLSVALAWMVLVDSALLTDQLVRDMREASVNKGWPVPAGHWLDFYVPQPSPEARAAFVEYVRCRWPIIVFALDPVIDQQNIADAFSQRREMQLSLSLAFVNGQISAQKMMRFARRLESEAETIALNNTAVGFSHGDNTFGWRFYPRFQTPEIQSNAAVFFRDLMIGGPSRDALLRQRRLEPGQRDCTAIVIMPSFVPYATLDVSGNWFSLVNPKHKEMNVTDAVKLSHRVKAIQECGPRVSDAHCFRDEEMEHLLQRAEQLSARLPLQKMFVQVPYENTLGGFAMFNSGVTDLAPELLGWYGAPGVNLDGTTTLFLIGNHFSVHQTRIIVGGLNIDSSSVELLSRQVMKISIPKGALAMELNTGTFKDCPPPQPLKCALGQPCADATTTKPPAAADKKNGCPPGSKCCCCLDSGVDGHQDLFVEVHVGTPYGVSSHLLIPACGAGGAKAAGAGAAGGGAAAKAPAWAKPQLTLGFLYKGLGIVPSDPPYYKPAQLVIQINPDPALKSGSSVKFSKMTLGGGASGKVPDFLLVLTDKNYDGDKNITLMDEPGAANLTSFVNALFTTLQTQFGPESDNPPTPVTLDASLVIGTHAPAALTNSLTINWVKAPVPKETP